jgi:hypothetical protein
MRVNKAHKRYPGCPFYCVPKHGGFTAQKAASAETFCDSRRPQGQDKRDKARSSPQIIKIKKKTLKTVPITFLSTLH